MKHALGAILACFLVAGCGSGGTDLLFALDLVVATNTPDSFSIAGVSTSLDGTRTYSWSSSKGQANLSIGSTLVAGSIRLKVYDGNNALVHDNTYEAALAGGVTAMTKSGGAAGTWTLQFIFSNAFWTGALTVHADTLDDADEISIGGTGSLDTSWIFEPGWNANPVNVSIGGVSGGSVHVLILDGGGATILDTVVTGVTAFSGPVSGVAGVWLVQIDYNSAVSAGAVTLSQP